MTDLEYVISKNWPVGIILYRKKGIVWVDGQDWNWLKEYRWCRGVNNSGPTARCKHKGQHIYMHRLILQAPAGVDVDHANQNTLDNRRQNIRFATRTQNCANRRSWGKIAYKGVAFHKATGKYRAYIHINRKQKHLGLYLDALTAAKVYNQAAREAFKEFAYLNPV